MAAWIDMSMTLSRSAPPQSPPASWPVCTLDALPATLAQGGWSVVEFWAPDCLFSRLLAPVRELLPKRFGDRIRWLCCPLAGVQTDVAALGADALPALVLFDGRRRVRRWLGAVDPSLLQRQIEFALARENCD